MSLTTEIQELAAQYPESRSAIMPALHLAQQKYGWLPPHALEEVGEALGLTPAYCMSVASFYDMYHLEPVGKYVVGVCTNIACLLAGGEELLNHASAALGCAVGSTSPDGLFTLEETECLADCNLAPCVQVNHRYVRSTTPEKFDEMIDDLRSGRLDHDVPSHGTLIRVRRNGGLRVERSAVAAERAEAKAAREARTAKESS